MEEPVHPSELLGRPFEQRDLLARETLGAEASRRCVEVVVGAYRLGEVQERAAAAPIEPVERGLRVQADERLGERALATVLLPGGASTIVPNAIAIRTCHSHHDRRQARPNATERSASARSTNATATASGRSCRRRRYNARYRDAAKP